MVQNKTNIFSKDLILLEWDCKDKDEALLTIATLMRDNKKLMCCDKFGKVPCPIDCSIFQGYLQSLHKREEQDCTSVGFDFAIPHGKCSTVAHPTVFFGRLTNPILWNPEEDEYVKYCFGIAVKEETNNEYLKILAELSCSILDDDFTEALKKVQTVDECYDILVKIQEKIAI